MSRFVRSSWILLSLVVLAACSQPAEKKETEQQAEQTREETKPPERAEETKPAPAETKPEAKVETKASKTDARKPAVNPLLTPHEPIMNKTAPETFKAEFETSKGTFIIQVTRSWAPQGADRFYNLVKNGFYDECRFFRVLPGFVAQFGINGDPTISSFWREARIPDDPVKASNKRGTICFATAGPNSRTTQLFINYGDNSRLDASGFSPFGEVVEGMSVVDSIYGEYGQTSDQGRIQTEGNKYLKSFFPKLDYIKKATIAP